MVQKLPKFVNIFLKTSKSSLNNPQKVFAKTLLKSLKNLILYPSYVEVFPTTSRHDLFKHFHQLKKFKCIMIRQVFMNFMILLENKTKLKLLDLNQQ